METLLKDVRYGVRMLLRNPGFTVVAVIALALGIGANAAIFSVVNGVLLSPLPYNEPERLMMILETKLPQFPEFSIAPGNFLEWKKQNTVFERLVAFKDTSLNLIGTGDPERLRVLNVTEGFFAMLGTKPQLGRDFLPEEDQPERNNVVILSQGLWQKRFGADPTILNQSIALSGKSYTVIGVMPATFRFGPLEEQIDLWTPMGFTAQEAQNHGGHYVAAIGQLKPGITVDQASAEMATIAGRVAAQYPAATGWGVKIVPLLEFSVRSIKPALLVLLVAVAFVLLIACANVASLLLARAAGRQKEIATRTALGAGRWRIVRQLLTESMLLSVVGGAVGLLLAKWGTDLLLTLAPSDLPRMDNVSVDGRALAFTAAITFLTGIIFGLLPALQASKPNLNEAMKDAARGSSEGRGRKLVRNTLVVLEVASALVLLIGAGLMIKSFYKLQEVDPGFEPNNALTASIELPTQRYPKETQQVAFFQQLIERVQALPGVEAAGASCVVPMTDNDFVLAFEIDGRPPLQPGTTQSTNYYSVSADYFKAMGIPLRRGRVFTAADTKDSPHVAVINETMARKIFPDEDPIGKRITFDDRDKNPDWYEIVGIVGDVKHYGLDQPTTMQTYEPYTQQTLPFMTLVVRTTGSPASLGPVIRSEILKLDKEQPATSIKTLHEFFSISVAQQRFSVVLLGVFAAVALVLAAVGIYGVLSYAVTQRTHEIGIRMALGAGRRDVFRLVVGGGMLLTLIGIVGGLVAAFALTRLIASLLFGVTATDTLTFVTVSAVVLGVALLACYIPARRATRVDPLVALRAD
jgi:putative ABC transport system permease protein